MLLLEAIAALSENERPLTLGVEPRGKEDAQLVFPGLVNQPLTKTTTRVPVIQFACSAPFWSVLAVQ
jgi:hypothetical protein